MKRRTFEEIIREEFCWPAAGDMPFVEAADYLENANIAGYAHTRLVLMMEGYKKGADIMIARTVEHEVDRDFFVCPSGLGGFAAGRAQAFQQGLS